MKTLLTLIVFTTLSLQAASKPIISKPGDLPRLREYMAQDKTQKKD
jgi:hypothetical protein